MTHYRIIEVRNYEDVYYILQIKKWWLFWVTVTEPTFSDVGPSREEVIFTSKLAAKEYYRKYYMKPKLTIVEEN
jgi:hypothetical protein